MTTILPPNRSSWDAISSAIGQNIQQNLPGAVQQGYQRGLGLSALNQAEQDIANANGDPYKIALAFAKAGAQNPNLERSLGPLAQTAMGFARSNNLYGPQSNIAGIQGTSTSGGGAQQQTDQEVQPRPTAYNIDTPAAMDAQARRDAQVTGNPQQYQQTLSNLQTKNAIATDYKNNLENMALREGISPQELPDFMEVGEKFASQNPDQWLKNTRAAYAPVKAVMDKLEKTFIPGLGSGLLGRDRQAYLNKITDDVQDLVKMGREDQVRKYLASQYLSPTEIAEQIHPLDRKQEAALSKLPQGIFPAQKKATYGDVADVFRGKMKENPFVSYEKALEKDPKALEIMKNNLSDFFLKTVDDKTSLLTLANKIWEDKDYNWQQIAPAIRDAQNKGLKLNPRQIAELSDLSQPPIQSLPDLFQDWWRPIQFLRGSK